MITKKFSINGIPSIKWGTDSNKIIIAVHGLMSNKADDVIKILAEEAVLKGYQVISFDLPEHGERKDRVRLNPWDCRKEIEGIYEYCIINKASISLFGCSIGAYMGILALKDRVLKQCMLISPMINMKSYIEHLMISSHISEERLKKEKTIKLSNGQNLDWEYYSYAMDNPIYVNAPTYVLYGTKDKIIIEKDVDAFAERNNACITKVDSEHYFHTREQLEMLRSWLHDILL